MNTLPYITVRVCKAIRGGHPSKLRFFYLIELEKYNNLVGWLYTLCVKIASSSATPDKNPPIF